MDDSFGLGGFILGGCAQPLRSLVKVGNAYQIGEIRRAREVGAWEGILSARRIYQDGRVEEWEIGRNKIVDAGLSSWARVTSGLSSDFNTYKIDEFAVGQGTTPETAFDTDLEAKLFGDAPSVAYPAVASREGKVQFTLTIPIGTPSGSTVWAITEAGLRATGAPNPLWTHKVFPPINKDSTAALQLLWTVRVSQA